MTTYTQKRVSVRTQFAFGDTQLSYSMRFGASVHEIVADYFQIQRSRRHTARRDWSRFRSGAAFTLAGLTAMTAQLVILGASLWMSLWLVPGLALIGAFVLVRGHYLELNADGDAFWIIDDKSTRTIVAEIDRRRIGVRHRHGMRRTRSRHFRPAVELHHVGAAVALVGEGGAVALPEDGGEIGGHVGRD